MSEMEIGGYYIIRKLGGGGYGEIYAVHKPDDSTVYAIKTESIETHQKGLESEISVLKQLPHASCFSNIITTGSTAAINFFAMPLYFNCIVV